MGLLPWELMVEQVTQTANELFYKYVIVIVRGAGKTQDDMKVHTNGLVQSEGSGRV